MKLSIILLLFPTLIFAQDFQIANIPQENMAPPPTELTSSIQPTLNNLGPAQQISMEPNASKAHTIHPPQKALTFDEFEQLLKKEKFEDQQTKIKTTKPVKEVNLNTKKDELY